MNPITKRKNKPKKKDNVGTTSGILVYIGLIGMLILILGVFTQPATLLQKVLFLVGALILAIVALKNNQKMLFVLQILITFGDILAFSNLGGMLKYAILLGAAVVGIGYLVFIKYYQKDILGLVGTLGLLLLALGFATDATTQPVYFGFLLGSGALIVALYALVDYYYHKNNIAIIWVILNIIFAINPLMLLVSSI